MKLVLLLVAIYSLIFYQSYKKEKLRIDNSGTKDLPAKEFRMADGDKGYQNALLLYKNDNSIYSAPVKKQPILRRLAFY